MELKSIRMVFIRKKDEIFLAFHEVSLQVLSEAIDFNNSTRKRSTTKQYAWMVLMRASYARILRKQRTQKPMNLIYILPSFLWSSLYSFCQTHAKDIICISLDQLANWVNSWSRTRLFWFYYERGSFLELLFYVEIFWILILKNIENQKIISTFIGNIE